MKDSPTWLRPKRWLAFFLTLLAVCSFLAIVPVNSEGTLSPSSAEGPAEETDWSFIDYLRQGAREVQVSGHWTSLLPPLLAIMIAAFFRTIVGALLSAFAVGSFLSYGLNPLATAVLGANDFLLKPTLSQFSVLLILFLLSLVGTVHVMVRSGGLEGLSRLLEGFVKGRRRAKLAIGLSGLLVFFDGYSSSVLVGSTMRRLADRWKISREKLAYLVDSTAAPAAGLALLSTWVVFEIYLLGEVAEQYDSALSGYGMLVAMLPLRFYCIGTLIFVFMSSACGRDFGPMLAAERRMLLDGKLMGDGHRLLGMKDGLDSSVGDSISPRWYNAVLPILVLLLGIVIGIFVHGNSPLASPLYDAGLMPVLLGSSLLAGVVALALPLIQGVVKVGGLFEAYGRGLSTMWVAIFILVMAWSMREICENLGTAQYLLTLLGSDVPLWMLPVLAFGLAAVTSFATGSSWGTLGILIPILMPLAVEMGAVQSEHAIIYLLTAAAILDGSIFGDHCSPISDTSILSALSSGCDPIAHVNTQLYYAVAVVSFSGLFGYLSVAHGMPVWTFYVFYPLAVGGFLWLFASKAEDSVSFEAATD